MEALLSAVQIGDLARAEELREQIDELYSGVIPSLGDPAAASIRDDLSAVMAQLEDVREGACPASALSVRAQGADYQRFRGATSYGP